MAVNLSGHNPRAQVMNSWGFSHSLLWISVCWIVGEGLIIRLSDPIVAGPGDDVILPCQLDPETDARNLVVEWLKLDFEPDPSGGLGQDDYVHLYRGGREVLDMKLPSYISRTQLFTEELQHGNVSLKILNVTSGDAGRYKCFIPNLVKYAVVQLVVDPDFKTRMTETPPPSRDFLTPDPRDKTDNKGVDQTRHSNGIVSVVCFFVLVLTLIVIAFLIKRCQKQRQTQKHDVECDVALNTQPLDEVP